jgi:5'-3' exonuclease
MGIENFFNTIIKNDISSDLLLIEEKIKCDFFYIDFNSILYILSNELEKDINYYLYALIINEFDGDTDKIELKYNIKFTTINEFNTYFNQNTINNIIKNNIYKYIQNLCRDLLYSDTLQKLYISIDGTPTMSKIVEQKKRRYMNYIVSKLKKNIYDKYSTTIPRDKQIFYDNYKSFNRGNMLTSGNYMQEIYNYLESSEYKTTIYNICKNLKDIKISSSYEIGEGEKKIMENILYEKQPGSYVIFSPDSDVVLLSLLMQNKLIKLNINTTFNLLRCEQIHNKIDNISICNLRKNILDYIFERMNTFRKYNHNKNNIIDDIIGLFTIFGNDFLPKIESINIKIGFNIIFDFYAKHLNWCRSSQYNLLFEENGITKINYDVLQNIFNRLSEFEDKILYDKYISTEYKNYKYLSTILEPNNITPFFIDRLNRYCHGYNKIIRYIKQNPNCDAENIYSRIINKFTDKEQWEVEFIKIENYINIDINTVSNKDIILSILQKMIDKLSVNETYKCGLKLVRYADNIDDKFHVNAMKDALLHTQMIVDDYDKEIYKFEKRMDTYRSIGTDNFDKIGYCEIKYKESEYKVHVDKNIDDKKYYFYNKILNCESQRDIDELCKEYLRGFFWTIDFYFNKNNRMQNINNISTWHYKYDHAPYFKEITDYLNSLSNRNVELNRINYSITDLSSGFYVKSSDFLTKFEQYMYITPKSNYAELPEIYKEVITDESIFMDLDKIANRIVNGENHLLDTYNIKYINKSNLIGLRDCDYNKFMNKILNLRKFNEIDD